MVEIFILVMNVLSALGVIILVLLQHGKGADMGAAFGSGSSGSLFGASGSANFLRRATGALAAVFFVTTLGLTYLSSHKVGGEGVMKKVIPTQLGPTPSLPSANDDVSKVKEIPK